MDAPYIIGLKHLPLTANAADIRKFFQGLRIPEGSVHIVGGPEGDAFIGFVSDEDAAIAMKNDGKCIHDKVVRLRLSSKSEMGRVIEKARNGQFNNAGGSSHSSIDATPSAIYQRNQMNYYQPTEGSPLNSYRQDFIGGETTRNWHRSENIQNDSWKNPTAYETTPWRDPKVLNALKSKPTVSQSQPVYQQQSMRDVQYGQDAFQGYTATLQPRNSNQEFMNRNADDPLRDPLRRRLVDGTNTHNAQAYSSNIPPSISSGQPLLTSGNSLPIVSTGAIGNTVRPLAIHPSASDASTPVFQPIPPRPPIKPVSRYVKFSRLPQELLQPAALEEFLNPKERLSLSSVKVVVDSSGFPLHTLVRFESDSDANNALARDEEQGIRIRACSKEEFDEAIDGRVPSFTSIRDTNKSHDRFKATTSRYNDGPRRYYSPERRVEIRRDDRDAQFIRDREERMGGRHSRTLLPHRRRSRSPNGYIQRYCLEFSNLPFRITESELRAHLARYHVEAIKVSRAFNIDGRASDRWVVEFDNFSFSEKAQRTRHVVQDRPLKVKCISNEEADRLLSVPDKFGQQKKEEYEKKHGISSDTVMDSENFESAPNTSKTFPANSRGRGKNFNHDVDREARFGGGAFASTASSSLVIENDGHRSPPASTSGPPPARRGPSSFRHNGPLIPNQQRATLLPSFSFFTQAPSSNVRQRGPPPAHTSRTPKPSLSDNNPGNSASRPSDLSITSTSTKTFISLENLPESFSEEEIARFLDISSSKITESTVQRGSNNIVYVDLGSSDEASKAASKNRKMIGGKHVAITQLTKEEVEKSLTQSEPTVELEPELIASVGKPGTVISCVGFPQNVTINDVAIFFANYSLIESSVRIKLDGKGESTGECLLAVGSPEEANNAVSELNGRRLNGRVVRMKRV